MFYFSKYRNFENNNIDLKRINLIQKVTNKKYYFSKTIFKLSDNRCKCLSQKIVFTKDELPISKRIEYLKILSEELNSLLRYKLIHGDLNQKNIRLGKDGYYVIYFASLYLRKI